MEFCLTNKLLGKFYLAVFSLNEPSLSPLMHLTPLNPEAQEHP